MLDILAYMNQVIWVLVNCNSKKEAEKREIKNS
jgi:hypothetical protein